MKVVHIAIACFYIEGWAYQENILPRCHKNMGLDVNIISSRFNKNEKDVPSLRNAGDYINADGIHVDILEYGRKNIFHKIIRATPVVGLYDRLQTLEPDIIFVHGCQFFNVLDVIRYKKENPHIKVYADQHGDYFNMPINTLKQKIVQNFIFGYYARSIAKYVEKYWGVTPWRVHYLQNVYKIDAAKTGLLIMGGDDSKIDFDNQSEIRARLRREVGVADDDFMIVTGGKIDALKNIHLLMDAVNQIGNRNIKLVIFGGIDDRMQNIFDSLLSEYIVHIGWIDSSHVYNWFLSADLLVFPGTHSVLWEQAVACGVPTIFKKWEGMQHVDVGGNCKFLTQDSAEEIRNVVLDIYNDKTLYAHMKQVSMDKGTKEFLYSEIAKRSIGV